MSLTRRPIQTLQGDSSFREERKRTTVVGKYQKICDIVVAVVDRDQRNHS